MESAGILEGLMLRRVGAESVAIWLAKDYTTEVESAICDLYSLNRFDTAKKTTSIRAGHRLPINLMRVPTDSLLGYNLLFRIGKILTNLASFELIHKIKDSISYKRLPCFSLFISR